MNGLEKKMRTFATVWFSKKEGKMVFNEYISENIRENGSQWMY